MLWLKSEKSSPGLFLGHPVWSSLIMSQHEPSMNQDVHVPILNHDDGNNNDSGFFSGERYQEDQDLFTTSDCFQEFETLKRNKLELSVSEFYYPELSSTSARSLLKDTSVGTFLVRDSSDSKYLFSLSVKTKQGATSVRLQYQNGLFCFDSDDKIRHRMPRFDSVMKLIDHHVHLSILGANKAWRWEDSSGKKCVPMELKKPLRKSVSSLSHLCTLQINQCLQSDHIPKPCHSAVLPQLNSETLRCIEEYPFRV